MTAGGRGGGQEGPGPDGGDDAGPPGGVSCEEALSRVYEYLDGELEREMQERINRHLEVCRRCYPRFDFERLFLDCVGEKGAAAEPPGRLEERVRRALDEEA